MRYYKVYLIGAGPGDPGLITVKGLEILRQAEVVIYDYLVDPRLLAEVKPDAELICCDAELCRTIGMPNISASASRRDTSKSNFIRDKLGKNRYSDGFLIHNEKISELVIKKVKVGKKVIRLKNGDPTIFSRTSQELEALVKNNIKFEIIPGVTAASAASAFSGIPLSDRRFASSCIFVTGHEDPTKNKSSLDWEVLSKNGTIVLYMAVENLAHIVKKLLSVGKDKNTPVAIIQDVGLFTQRVLIGTLQNIALKAKKAKIRPPAIIIIGEVVNLEKNFNWLKKPKKILFTGISTQRFFQEEIFFHLPLIKIEPLKDYQRFDYLLKNISQYDWIVFSSRYGVQYFFARLAGLGFDTRVLQGLKVAAIGNSTRNRLLDFGIIADLVPKEESSQGLLNAFKKTDIKNQKIFLPRSDLADKGLEKALKLEGAEVTSGVAYQNVMPQDLPDLDFKFFNEIMFSSPSGVRNFVKRYKSLPKNVKVSCIGEVTRNEAKRWHLLN